MRSSYRSIVQDCSAALFGLIGALTSGPAAGTAAWLGQYVGDVYSRNLENEVIDDRLRLQPGPPICPYLGCNDAKSHDIPTPIRMKHCVSCN